MYRTTETLTCPRIRCRKAVLETSVLPQCPSCRGVWIPEPALVERIAEMSNPPPPLEWKHEARVVLPCALCRQSMETLSLYGVPVDRCRGHGVWLDGGELDEVLELCKHPPTKAESGTLTGWTPARANVNAPVAADAVAWAAVDVAAGSVDVVGGVVEVASTVEDAFFAGGADEAANAAEVSTGVGSAASNAGSAAIGAGDVASGAASAGSSVGDVASGPGDVAIGVAEAAGGVAEAGGGIVEAAGGAVEIAGGAAEVAGGALEIVGGLLEGLGSILDF